MRIGWRYKNKRVSHQVDLILNASLGFDLLTNSKLFSTDFIVVFLNLVGPFDMVHLFIAISFFTSYCFFKGTDFQDNVRVKNKLINKALKDRSQGQLSKK